MNQEQYIENEVKIRLHEENFILMSSRTNEMFSLLIKNINEKFNSTDKRIDKLNNKFNILCYFILGSVIVPIIMHHYK